MWDILKLRQSDCERDSTGRYLNPTRHEYDGGGSSGGFIYDRPSFLGPDYGSSFGRYKRAINSTGPETILNEFKLKNPISIVQLGNSSLAWAIGKCHSFIQVYLSTTGSVTFQSLKKILSTL